VTTLAAAPTISIITPAFNASEFLGETIASALAQTWRDFELLVIDDGSTDDTMSIARTWEREDARVRVLTRARGGPAAARNTGIAHARGDFLALLDSDDVWLPSFLDAQMSVFRDWQRCDVVTGNAYNRGGPRDGKPLKAVGLRRELSLRQILESESSVCIMSVFRRTVAERIGGFNESLPVNEDYDFWVRAAHAGFVFVHNPIPLGYYRRRSDSLSSNELQMLTGAVQVFKSARTLCAGRADEVAAIDQQLQRLEQARLFASGKANLVRRDFTAAADDFSSLVNVRRDFMSTAIAQMSKYVPAALLWIYRVKRAWTARARALSIYFSQTNRAARGARQRLT
jgi:teichuronic acid biosynthesis glycosyltransferase TuaG